MGKDRDEGEALIEKLTAMGLLIDVRPQLFSEGGSTPELGISLSDRLLFARIVFPTYRFGPNGKAAPEGIDYYRTLGGVWTPVAKRNAYGLQPVGIAYSATDPSITQPVIFGCGPLPYGSDGATIYTASPGYMRHTSITVTSDAAGAVAAVNLVAAGAAGVKWVLYDLSVGGGMVSSLLGDYNRGTFTLSDGCGFIGAQEHRMGPVKQGTAATNVTLLAANGDCPPTTDFTINCSYRQGA